MGLFYTASPKELLQIRNKIFLDFGIPSLKKNGFQKSPFSTSYFGGFQFGYSYELCRLADRAELEVITVYIVRGDKWIQISLNIFKIEPKADSLSQLKGLEGIKFGAPPCSSSDMRFNCDDIKGAPILNYNYMFRDHNIKSYYTKSRLEKRASDLGKIIETDLSNIDRFVKRWHEIYQPLTTTWEGVPVK